MTKQLFEEANVTSGRETIDMDEALKQRELQKALPQPDAPEQNLALFPPGDLDTYRNRWREVQGCFVDEPRAAVQKADELVSEVIRHLTEGFGSERSRLEQQWGESRDVSTEDLRQALRRYRSFFDRLLAVG
jgi:hypothetical protein